MNDKKKLTMMIDLDTFNKMLDRPSLRDQFAMAALTGLCQTMSRDRINDIEEGIQAGGIEARAAYIIADAMLRERNKQGEDDGS